MNWFCYFSVEINKCARDHTKKVVSHALHFNQSYKELEEMAKIINSTPNASIRVPTSKYMLKKSVKQNLSIEYHIRCAECKNTTISISSGVLVECETCLKKISTANSDFFIYIPIEQQLRKIIDEHFYEICSYPSSVDENFITDVHDGIQFKNASEKYKGSKVLSMVVCTDGIQVFNSSYKSLWAIQLYLNFLKPPMRYIAKNIMVVALYSGKKKPNMQEFFYPLLKELQQLIELGGLSVKKNGQLHYFMPLITHCCCDLPAKADVQGMTTHSGYNACGFCLNPGTLIKKNEKSKSVVRYTNRNKNEVARTHEQMLSTYRKLKSKPIDGLKSVSCLIALADFDLVNGFCIDYMHAVLLGIMKKQLSLWLDSSNHREPYYIKPKLQQVLNTRIQNMKPPSEMARRPRSIFEIGNFKANEYRSLLLYYLPNTLFGLLKKSYVEHFHLLSSAIYMLLEEKIPIQNVAKAENKLIQYADDYEKLYGKHNVTINLHLMRHVGIAVKNLGPLWTQSAFGMESNNGILGKTTAKNNILHSIAWRYVTKFSLESIEHGKKITVGGPKQINLNAGQLNALSIFGLESHKQTIYEFVTLNGIKYTSKTSKPTAAIDYFLRLKNEKCGAVDFYFVDKLVVHGLMDEYGIVSSKDHFNKVTGLGQYAVFNINEVEKKLLYMNIRDEEFITSIPNRFEKS